MSPIRSPSFCSTTRSVKFAIDDFPIRPHSFAFLLPKGITLDAGPVTIYDEDTCIGETMLDSIRPGGAFEIPNLILSPLFDLLPVLCADDKFLPYGVDKQVSVSTTDRDSLQPIHKTNIRSVIAIIR